MKFHGEPLYFFHQNTSFAVNPNDLTYLGGHEYIGDQGTDYDIVDIEGGFKMVLRTTESYLSFYKVDGAHRVYDSFSITTGNKVRSLAVSITDYFVLSTTETDTFFFNKGVNAFDRDSL